MHIVPIINKKMDIYLIPELELNRKLEVELDRKPELELDNCSHPIPELKLDRPFIKELELELDNYNRCFRRSRF